MDDAKSFAWIDLLPWRCGILVHKLSNATKMHFLVGCQHFSWHYYTRYYIDVVFMLPGHVEIMLWYDSVQAKRVLQCSQKVIFHPETGPWFFQNDQNPECFHSNVFLSEFVIFPAVYALTIYDQHTG